MLKARRHELALTQVQASSIIGVDQRTYSAWERGRTPGRANLAAIAQFLEKPLERVAGLTVHGAVERQTHPEQDRITSP